LQELFDCDAEAGILTWKMPGQGRKVGHQAGTQRPDKYWIVSIDNNRYAVHRIIYSMHHQVEPVGCVDHMNGDPSDNRIDNLRLVTYRQNNSNRKHHRAGKLVGASRLKNGRWQSRIWVEGKPIQIGTFATEQEAHDAYKNACEIVRQIESTPSQETQ